ncbi:putative E3 ubiquitin protein ligase [Ceratocystis fimbriata CBS 114723]|uniref:HECT-type E3 ubiquitin transferase n=1 Tax=Ceratocystis fimbriata CBS 114723 TaxID=1035309 RepID=A0A2C5XBZ4_9PEZI|nr:putative E3 ubiquitin protein ligase [Ceratocystis fimbriata CBS 114723]
MIPSFSGNSRRTRNVNLSGRGGNSAFSIWAPSSGFGASDTVNKAEEKRKRRQLEKKKSEAAQTVQKVWRGHKTRSSLRRSRQLELDKLYSPAPELDPRRRLHTAVPLISATFRPTTIDCQRMLAVVRDIRKVGPEALPSLASGVQLRLFSDKIIDALRMLLPFNLSTIDIRDFDDLLYALSLVASCAGFSLRPQLPKYYGILTDIRDCLSLSQETRDNWVAAVRAPLELSCSNMVDEDYVVSVYKAFSFSLLTHESTDVARTIMKSLAGMINISVLSSVIVDEFSKNKGKSKHNSEALWLVAHLILLGFEAGHDTTYGTFMDALLTLMSIIPEQLIHPASRKDSEPLDQMSDNEVESEDEENDAKTTVEKIEIPPYVKEQLESLTTQAAIETLIKSFNLETLKTPQEVALATSTIAGYMMCLFKCFPKQRDEISLRLFLANINTPKCAIPLLQHFLSVVLKTTIYRRVISSDLEPLATLKQYLDSPLNQNAQDTEWRIILLTLDLYSFVLRLTDDDDFFARLVIPDESLTLETPRIQRCNLPMAEISSLSRFLCEMSFPLYNNKTELEASSNIQSPILATVSPQPGAFWSSGETHGIKAQQEQQSDSSLIKLDLPRLKVIITSALKMIYDRDSRRRFLPEGHWLMTTKFNMSGFVTEVVIEHERQSAAEDEELEDTEEAESFNSHRYLRSPLSQSYQIRREAQRRKVHRARMTAIIGPRLEVLRYMPFVIPFETRVELMRKFVQMDRMKMRKGRIDHENLRAALNNDDSGFLRGRDVRIKRQELFESAFDELWQLGAGLKNPLHITFVDQFGATEAGIDGGGVTKEFLISLTSEAFGGSRLFTTNSQNQYYPDPSQYDWYYQLSRKASTTEEKQECFAKMKGILNRYEFLGRILGKCIYEGILVDASFAPFFLLKWIMGISGATGYKGNVNDLRDLDEQTYQGLVMLKNARDASEMELDFTVDDKAEIPGTAPIYITRNLIPNGDQVMVTNENRLLYTSYFSRHRLVVQSQQISAAFLRGLWDIIAPSWISMFNQWELQRLVGGDSAPVNLDDWRANTYYGGIYVIGDDGEEHPVIKWFWEVMYEFDEGQRRQVLQYATSVPRAPLLGFSQLNPRFAIRDSRSSSDVERLPSASTCMNLLKLPPYKSKDVMRQKLLYAIQSGAGFELS